MRQVCIPGQRRPPRVGIVTSMTLEDMKIAVVLAWAVVWSVIAVALVSSLSHWILVVGAGVLPPLVILRMWQPAAQPVPVRSRGTHQ